MFCNILAWVKECFTPSDIEPEYKYRLRVLQHDCQHLTHNDSFLLTPQLVDYVNELDKRAIYRRYGFIERSQ